MRTIVAITKCSRYEPEAVREALGRVLKPYGGPQELIHPGWRVLLKPNFVVADRAEELSTTHPIVVEAAILAVKAAGATPVVGDSPAFGSARRVAKVSGVLAICERHGVEVIDLNHAQPAPHKSSGGAAVTRYPKLTISGRALEADWILNLPKLKAHCQLRLTGAVKNLYGCVSGKRKWWRHMRSGNDLHLFACMLVKNAYLLPRTFTIVDAIVGMHKTGPRRGSPYPLGLLVAGPDPVAVDRVLAEIIGLPSERLATLEAARTLEFGVPDLNAITIAGEPLDAVRVTNFQVPNELHDIVFKPTRVLQSLFRTLWLKAREHAPAYH
ncbi:MAG: DUF362 domain-containing protein [Elusimicrobia bacterium]|nr:DUF362 domain-containing protein [Elusimicrobiota bacterium]